MLTNGCVQEEIRFITTPETLVSCLLCESMGKDEAIIIIGTQQHVNYEGYSRSFKVVSKREQVNERLVLVLSGLCVCLGLRLDITRHVS